MDDIRHVVILMQENRSFDHYLGTLDGVRGFDDQQALTFRDGQSVFRQPARFREDGYLLPFPLSSGAAQHVLELPHDWDTGHAAVNQGAMDGWVGAKGPMTMGYLTRADIPFHYALADEFTICDGYFCSLAGPTSPNRLYLWSGTAGPGRDGTTGPWIDNTPLPESPVADWTTYAERLEAAGVSWRVYNTPGMDEATGNYGDNGLEYFAQFHSDADFVAKARTPTDLSDFDADCRSGTLPTVSWLVAPYAYCEHPSASPAYGAHWVNTALQSVFANSEIWEHTVFLLMYDENDGFFDHVIPPMPPAGTAEEFVDGQAIGLGNRVPLWVISPWSRGGWINSQVFDHTSVLRFLERVTGVEEPHISAWRRAVCGDLMTCFDFSTPDFSVPSLPDTDALVDFADRSLTQPVATPPETESQRMPSQEPARGRPHRELPYRPIADISVEDSLMTLRMQNLGEVAFPFTVIPNFAFPFQGTPYTVEPGEIADHRWELARTAGWYDLSVYGPDGFVCRFVGCSSDPCSATARLSDDGSALAVTVSNNGSVNEKFTVTEGSTTHTEIVRPGATVTVDWDIARTYDISVTVESAPFFLQRYAATVHTLRIN